MTERTALEERLRLGARARRTGPTDLLHRRIVAALTAEPPPAAARPVRMRLLPAIGLAALFLAAAAGVWHWPIPAEAPPPALHGLALAPDAFPPALLLGPLEEPLNQEAAALKADLLSASRRLFQVAGL